MKDFRIRLHGVIKTGGVEHNLTVFLGRGKVREVGVNGKKQRA